MKKFGSFFVDTLSIFSLVGIWPRYVEPRLLKKTYLDYFLSHKNKDLKGLKILQFSDLHFHQNFSTSFLKKIAQNIHNESPDLIFFTGDFLCYSQMAKEDVLRDFLSSLKAPLGRFCVFGNHDYAQYVSRKSNGDYGIKTPINPIMGVAKGLSILLFEKPGKKGQVSEEAKKIPEHENLVQLLKNSSFHILDNDTCTLPCGLNIVGLGEYGLGRTLPHLAFKKYDERYPGIVLVHNPDATPLLNGFPGDLILSGHTHGEQIHLPFCRFISRKLARLENPQLTRGLFHLKDKQLYVSRGVGGHEPFRFCSPPELLVIRIT